jgi:hypothetical protein
MKDHLSQVKAHKLSGTEATMELSNMDLTEIGCGNGRWLELT